MLGGCRYGTKASLQRLAPLNRPHPVPTTLDHMWTTDLRTKTKKGLRLLATL